MPNDSFLIKDISDGLANCHHIHVGQRLLWKEATSINIVSGSKSIHRSNYLHLSIWFNHEGDTWTCHLVAHACWGCFNNASDSTKETHVFIPIFEQRRHCNLHLFGEIFCNDRLNLLNQINGMINLLLFERLQWLD
jgi:hypothetical protein